MHRKFCKQLYATCRRSDVLPGFGRVGGLLRSLEDEMADILSHFGMSDAVSPGSVLEVGALTRF